MSRLTHLLAAGLFAAAVFPAQAADPPLAVDDVSWLFPMPTTAADLETTIPMDAVKGRGGGPAWSDSATAQFFAIAESAGKVKGHAIKFDARMLDRVTWRIAGVRIDPVAPGGAPVIAAAFGQLPQIRLIVQPVLIEGGQVKVKDIAAHLIFSYDAGKENQTGCLPRFIPNDAKVRQFANDLLALKQRLANGEVGGVKIDTSDNVLGVHPAFLDPGSRKAFRDEVLKFLNTHLPEGAPTSMAVAGIPHPAPEPWIFLAMQGVPEDGKLHYGAVPSPALDGTQKAQMLSFAGGIPDVQPAPVPNNGNDITCKNAVLGKPVEGAKGLATAELFQGNAGEARVREIVERIGDPAKSHFFNTDCVSCHTDTRLGHAKGNMVFPGVAAADLPQDKWNIRNFGWFPRSGEGATATNRTFREAEESAAFFNKLLGL